MVLPNVLETLFRGNDDVDVASQSQSPQMPLYKRAINAGSANAGLVPDRRYEAQEGVCGTIVYTLRR
jgi:hypothetical protein